MGKVTTVVMKKDGALHAALERCTPEDARRWADEGFLVFQIAARSARDWAIFFINDEKLFTSTTPPLEPGTAERAGLLLKLTKREAP